MHSFGPRLRQAIEQADITQQELADKLGVTQQAIQYACSGKAKGSKHIEKMAKLLKVSPEWLAFGTTNQVSEERATYEATNQVPSYTIKQLDRNEQATSLVSCPFPHGPNTYAFTVEGIQGSPTPMHSQHGRAYPIGSVVFVDPDQADQVKNGDPVAAMLTDENAFCFRMLYREGGTEILMPLNPQFPAVNRPYKIIGKVIGAILP